MDEYFFNRICYNQCKNHKQKYQSANCIKLTNNKDEEN